MALSKETTIDKIETLKVQDYYNIQVREVIQVIEDGEVISQKYLRYILTPDTDVSTITDAVVKAQFKAIMTTKVKANYKTYLASQSV